MEPKQQKSNLCLPIGRNSKRGFGIAEVLVSAAVLGFMVVALNKLQTSNHDTFLRIRGRDGAVELAQNVLDSLNSVGAASIASKADGDTTYPLDSITRRWARGLGGDATIRYARQITVAKTDDFEAASHSNYEDASHIYAKQVNVRVSWSFKGSNQSINVSGVIR